ncbi:MAG: hypothetical protein ACK6CT_06920 [Planctomycetia bacterium]
MPTCQPSRYAAAVQLAPDTPVKAVWKSVPLRIWADRVAEIAGGPVVIDRRLDPEVAVTLDARGESLAAVLEKVARAAGARVVWLRSSIRLVPAGSAADVCSRAERAREIAVVRLPAAVRQVVARRAEWAWKGGARPRDLVAAALDQAGLEVEGIDRVPHDHFPEAMLPPLSLGERLDLMLAHFDLRIDWRGGAVGPVAVIVPIDAGLPTASPTEPLASGQVERPESPVRTPAKPPRGDAGRNGKAGQTVKTKQTFTLKAAAPLEELLAAIAGRLEVSLDVDRKGIEARGIALQEIVRVEVKDASADELLAAVLGPLKLTGKIIAGRLEVRGADLP